MKLLKLLQASAVGVGLMGVALGAFAAIQHGYQGSSNPNGVIAPKDYSGTYIVIPNYTGDVLHVCAYGDDDSKCWNEGYHMFYISDWGYYHPTNIVISDISHSSNRSFFDNSVQCHAVINVVPGPDGEIVYSDCDNTLQSK